ncbi:MAG: hypothetical protein WBE22_10510 [Halobacteriota archaeon]
MIAKIALMIVAISVAVVMAVSCVIPCIAVDDLKDNALTDESLLREAVTEKSFAEMMHFYASTDGTNHAHRMPFDHPRVNEEGGFNILSDSDVSIAKSLTLTTKSLSSAPEEEWNRTFGGLENDCINAARQTSDGGYIIAGYTCSYGDIHGDFWLIKTDAKGNKQWDKIFYGRSGFDNAHSVQQTRDGGYILAGFTRHFPRTSPEEDIWLIKTDANGNKEWDKIFGGFDMDMASSVQQTHDSGYIIAGETRSYGAGLDNFWLIKTDSSGNKVWDTLKFHLVSF